MGRRVRRGRALMVGILLLSLLSGVVRAQPAAAASERWCPPETGYCAANAFLDFWKAHGGLETLGYPITAPHREGNGLIFQYYERAVMEWHPEQARDYQVLLTLLGSLYQHGTPATKQAPVPCVGACALFGETNHTLRGPFLDYWQTYGGLAVYGYPLTEEIQERNAADGRVYTVQYFERNRFEYHPENAGTRYAVQLGRLGAEVLAENPDAVNSWPVVEVPNYGDTATAPPASPTVTVSPTSAPAGTKLIASGANFPAGATIEWTFRYGGAVSNSGSFPRNPGDTAFTFTINTDGSAAGAYSITFSVGGRALGSANFTITGATPAPTQPAIPRWHGMPVYPVLQNIGREGTDTYNGVTCATISYAPQPLLSTPKEAYTKEAY